MNYRNLKNWFPIIAGLIIGISISCGMIYRDQYVPPYTAFGEAGVPWQDGDNWTTELAAWSEKYKSWKNIFSKTSNAGQDLYKFVSKKLVLESKNEAIRVIAENYGLTEQEANSAIGGSISAIVNSSKFPPSVTTEKAYEIIQTMHDEYEMYVELFDIQQDIDTSIGPTEMFANGDLQDSGFDLLRDLGVMEKILFKDETEVQGGKPLAPGSKGSSDSILPSSLAPSPPPQKQGSGQKSPVTIDENPTGPNGEPQKIAIINTGADEPIKATVEDEDVCPTNDPMQDALNKYNLENPKKPDQNADGQEGSAGENDGIGNGAGEGTAHVGGEEASATGKLVEPADSGSTPIGFCGQTFKGSPAPDMESIGGADGNIASEGIPGFSVNVALCIKIELIKAKAVAVSNDSCIRCEIEKINVAFNKTLGHSMIPNKTTGNIFESASCKKSFGNQLDFQMQLIYQPLPAPQNEDILFGKNMMEEWNRFVDNAKPFGYSKWDKDVAASFNETAVVGGTSLEEMVLRTETDIAKNKASAIAEVTANALAEEGTNMVMYTEPILKQMRQMKGFFDGYKAQYDALKDLCSNDIMTKGDCQ